MKYNQTLLFLILILITFNFVLPIYGNSKQECKKCLEKCCNNYKNQHQLETCNDTCKLEHCDGVKINYKDYECPPKPSNTHKPDPPKTHDPIPTTTIIDQPETIPTQPNNPIQPSPDPIQSPQPNPIQPSPDPIQSPQPNPPQSDPIESIPVKSPQPIPPTQPVQPTPAPPIQPQTNPLGPVPPFPPQEVHTCSTPDDPACFPPGSTPIVTTFTQPVVETPTPPSGNEKLTTTQSTSTMYVAGYTTTNSLGQTIIIPPSSLLVVKEVAIVTENSAATVTENAATTLHEFNSHGLWGVTMSLFIVSTTLVFMVIA